MTLQQLCEKYDLKESTVKSNFKRSQESIFKKTGVKVIREGRGDKTTYRELVVSDNRAESMFKALEPMQNTGIIKKDLSMPNFTFTVFLGIITTPMLVFRGTYNDFLKYVEIAITKENIESLKKSIQELIDEHVINCITDMTTDENVVTLSLVRSAEVEMKIGIDMIRICKQLSTKYHKRDWIPLLKVWLGTELLSKKDFYTQQELINMTGLSKYQIIEVSRVLKESNIYITTRAYKGYQKCIGMSADMNIKDFYNVE